MPRRKVDWEAGDVFLVQQKDGACSVGQILDRMMMNVASCAFFDIRVPAAERCGQFDLGEERLIAALSVSSESLDYGRWKIVGRQPVVIDRDVWPNEACREVLWVGAKVYDASIAGELLDAYNGLVPWDDWHDPDYLDKLLVAPERKPKHIFYKKR